MDTLEDSKYGLDCQFSPSLSMKSGFLHCEDVRVVDLQRQLAELYGDKPGASPFFVYSKSQIIQNVGNYRAALDGTGVPYLIGYSMKANYNRHVLHLVAGQPNVGVVAVSGNEVLLAVSEGINGDRVIFNGNGKQRWELECAISAGCLLNVDSVFDVRRLLVVVAEFQRTVRILLRINPDINADVHPFLATGLAKSKFGIDDSQIDDVLDLIKEQPLLRLVGLHCHLGSTIDNTLVFRESLEVMLKLSDSLRDRGFTDIQIINLGGGLGIDYCRSTMMQLVARWALDRSTRESISKPVRDNCVETLPPHGVTAVGQLLTLNCLGGDWPSFTFIHREARTKSPLVESTLTDEQCRVVLLKFSEQVQSALSAEDPEKCSAVCKLLQSTASKGVRAVDGDFVNQACTLLNSNNVLLKALKTALPWMYIPTVVPSPADLMEAVGDLLREAVTRWPSFTLIIEPGRSIVGNTATLITKVLGWKRNGTKRYIVVDGSMTEVLRPALYGSYHHIEITEPLGIGQTKDVFDVVGPVCECGDFLGRDRWLPQPHEGCGLAVFDTGAYCSSMASNYNMRRSFDKMY